MGQSHKNSGKGKKPRLGKKPPKRSATNIATTALGEEPEKRSLKSRAKSDAGERSRRELAQKVKSARGRKISSTLWLQRQLNDPFVIRARQEGYRSRAAYKIIELNKKFNLFKKGGRIVDLGAAPGGWCQVAARETNSISGKGVVVGIDYLGMPPIEGAQLLEMDFLDEQAPARLKELLGGKANVVMSDMAAPTTGHKSTDHIKIIALVETALDFAQEVLVPGGHFVAKTFQGGAAADLVARLKRNFQRTVHAKPEASRADSSEMYVVALGYKGEQK
ncbi:MAG: RlmE family RNA methyltransferase [bacterium]